MEILTKRPEETILFAKGLARFLKPGDLLLLYGELGSGKTTFIKGLCEGLGVPEDTLVVSPTFSLVNIYEGRYQIFHVDLYRLSEEEAWELGLWEALKEGIVVVEWANRLSYLPPEVKPLRITLEYVSEEVRKITLEGPQEWLHILKELDRDD